MLSRLFIVLACCLSAVHAVEPLFNPVPFASRPEASGDRLGRETAAVRALSLGLPSAAVAIYEQLLAEEPDSPVFNDRVLALATARMEAGRLEQAAVDLERFRGTPTAALRLRQGLLAAQRAHVSAAQIQLAGMRPEELTTMDRPWFFLLQGLVAELNRDTTKAGQAYDQAEEAAANDWQRASFLLARERIRLVSGEVTEQQANSLRQSAERYQGRTVGYDFGRQYAVALERIGRRADAIDYLQRQLQALSATDRAVRDEYRLLLGVLAGAEDPAGRLALESLLNESDDRGRLRAALRLLTESSRSGGARGGFLSLIGRLIDRADPPHPILDSLLLVRSEFALSNRQFDQAEQDAKALLARFPGSELKPLALTQLAQNAWEQLRFRTAADYASQAQSEARDPELRSRLGVFIAEAYYQAGDFRSAADAYAAAARDVPAGVSPGSVFFQRVMAELKTGRLTEAAALLSEISDDPRFDALSRWQAEWNLARALQMAGRTGDALQRITRLRAGRESAKLPAELMARMAWLQARLALDAGDAERSLQLSAQLPGLLAGVEPGLRTDIASLTSLLSAEAKFRLGRADDAVVELKGLRGSDAAGAEDAKLRSFIIEADYYARIGRVVEAQALLTRMADEYPKSEYADDALFKAALNAERRGKDEYFEQAYRLLYRLVTEYPKSDLVFAALMRQGDLKRRLNDFAGAQLFYESLINTYSGQPGVLAAQLALGACHRAQVSADPSHFESAATIFERLRDLPSAPGELRIEAGFQLGDMFFQRAEIRAQQGDASGRKADADRARAVWWPLVSAYLGGAQDSPDAAGPRARYWLARALVRMSDLAESEGRREESLEACRLIIQKGLPGEALARSRLSARPAAQ